MNESVHIKASGLKKVFNGRTIFSDISFLLTPGQTLLITGRNGSGKSTLVKILCGLLTPTAGSVDRGGGPRRSEAALLAEIGLVAPYLQMYDEFSAVENMRSALAMRGLKPSAYDVDVVLRRVGLYARRADDVRTYSSGMKQRMKFAFALIHCPSILFLDEPMANLDSEGMEMVRGVLREQRSKGMLVVATNEVNDVDTFDQKVNLDDAARR
jgi:heme exporter protein A